MEQGSFDKQAVLRLIEYRKGEGPYVHCCMEDNKLVFSDVDPRMALRQRLSLRLQSARGTRTHHRLTSWKKYYELVNLPGLRGVQIPTPKEIVQNKDAYQTVRNMNPSAWLSQYIELCVSEESQLTA